ncbi:MAG TPA: hypothetical protein VG144_09160 [Gaiellaceae bacterium]|nr:hypothetical protein [Gaiellaceae bacterium]
MATLNGDFTVTSWDEETPAERRDGGDVDGKGRPGSATGEWASMRGEGHFQAPHGSKASFTLDCSFD